METTTLLALVRLAITGEADTLSLPPNPDWAKVFALARRGGVTALAWHGVELAYQAGALQMPASVKMQWYAAARSSMGQMERLRAVSADFAKQLQPLRCVVLKGMDYARLWPDALWRECGDLDLWLCGDFEKGNERAIALGADFDAHDYKHSHITYRGLMVENHRYLTYFGGTRQGRRTELFLEKCLTDGTFTPIPGTQLLSPPMEFTLVYFLRHALQHFLSEGIALRHVLDWFFLLRAAPYIIIKESFPETLRDLGLLPFASLLSDYLRQMGLPVGNSFPLTTSPRLLALFSQDLFQPHAPLPTTYLSRLRNKWAFISHTWRFRQALNEPFLVKAWSLVAYSKVFRKRAEL